MAIPHSSRRVVGAVAAALALTLGLSACGSSDTGGNAESTDASGDAAGGDSSADADHEPVTIRFAWWGSDTRHEVTQKVIEAFEAEYPYITVEPDYTSWDNYFEKLNVAAAGNDLPDVITQEERFLTEYADRGLLANLDELGLDTANIDESVLQSGTIDDALYGIATGINVHAIIADPQAFADAGVEMPDDTTWTWDDYEQIATDISAGSADGGYGVQNYSFIEPVLKIIARQKGEEVFTADGEVGVSAATVEEFFQRSVDLQSAGGEPDASVSTEIQAAGVEGSLPATNKGAMAWFWSNQLNAVQTASGRDLVLLRAPGESEFERTGEYFKPSMYYSVSAKSEHPEESQLLVDFLINSNAAGELILSDRGLPANTEVRAHVLPMLSDADKLSAEFVENLQDVVVDGTPVPPVGAGEVPDITSRINSDVLFGKITPAQAAEQWIDEVTKAIS